MAASFPTYQLRKLRSLYGERLQENVVLANYTTAKVGGPADALLILRSANELSETIQKMWELDIPYYLLGSGSNVLISDTGLRGLVLINRAHTVKIDAHTESPTVWCESGANLSGVARQVALRGLSGLEWACTIPGTVGGAVYGNAGAYDSDIARTLIVAEILHHSEKRVTWSVEKMDYSYRSSILKRTPGQAVILAVRLKLKPSTEEEVHHLMDEYRAKRRRTQPPGASLGSMFKNPAGDFAGRLIEAAGLKGTVIGDAQISPLHANFFINRGNASARDLHQLMLLTQKTVFQKFGVQLEPEVEWVGEWQNGSTPDANKAAPSKKVKGNS